jgi:LmbE family N-acetylglucosaminyl deacetylase
MNVLGIGSHPDDLEIACGGTLAKYAKLGHNVYMCHIANGDQGHKIIMPEELGKLREKEAENAAAVIGAKKAFNINVPDGLVEPCKQETLLKVMEVIRQTKPDIIITHNDDDYMRDHKNASELAYTASFLATLGHMETETPAIDKVVPVFYMDTVAGINFQPTEYVDITETIEIKLQALEKHESQIKWMRDHDHIDFVDFVRTCSKYRGFQCGVAYAEGFRPYLGYLRPTTKRLLP